MSTMKTVRNWGLVVPGRPPTPSEGHAQSYARIGPEASQRLVSFANGTCLSFGPDDVVDEFLSGKHPFTNQVALIDKAIRDCKSVSDRYPAAKATHDGDDSAYDDFRSHLLPDHTTLPKITLESGTYVQVPSRLATVGTLISVHANPNKSDIPGNSHPGFSVDTRFGGKENYGALLQHAKHQTELKNEVIERQEDAMPKTGQNRPAQARYTGMPEAQQAVQASRQQQQQQQPHTARRGKRRPQSRSTTNTVQLPHQRNGLSRNVDRSINPQSQQGQQGQQGHQASQPLSARALPQANAHSHNSDHTNGHHSLQKDQIQETQNVQVHHGYNDQYSPIMNEDGLIVPADSNGAHFDLYPEIIAEQIVRNEVMSGNAAKFKHDILTRFAPDLFAGGLPAGLPAGVTAGPPAHRLQHYPDQNFGGQDYSNQTNVTYNYFNQINDGDEYDNDGNNYATKANFSRHRSVKQVYNARNLNVQSQGSQPQGSQPQNYTTHHGHTAFRSTPKYAVYLNELDKGAPRLSTQRLDRNALAGEPAFTVFPPTPTALAAITVRNDIHPQTLLDLNWSQPEPLSQSYPLSPRPRRNSRAHFLNGTDDPRIPASSRPPTRTASSQATELSPRFSGMTIFGEQPGNVTRERSRESRGRRLFAPRLGSRRSSPGKEATWMEHNQERSASAGYQV